MEEMTKEEILDCFFKRDKTTETQAVIRIVLNIIVKILYVCSNLISFLAMDNVLNGEFIPYGVR